MIISKNMLESHGVCKLTMGKNLDYSQVYSMGVGKNFRYLPLINKE